MLTLEVIIKKLEDRNISEVARRTDLSAPYIRAIIKKERTNPSYSHIKKLSDYLEEK